MLTRREAHQLLAALAAQQGYQLNGQSYVPLELTLNLVATFTDPTPKLTKKEGGWTIEWDK